jgi:ketosteroid isomerase-like protein
MPSTKKQALHAAGSPDELEASFYEALNKADIAQLMACWADEDEIVCVHPGGPRFMGQGAIRASFEGIFQNAGAIAASIHKRHAVLTLTTAVHSVIECIQVGTPEQPQQAYVIATNVYAKTAQGWRMVAHHASPGTPREMQELSDAPAVFH